MPKSRSAKHRISCGRKVRHKTLGSAQEAAQKLYGAVTPYVCRACGYYHTGRPTKRDKVTKDQDSTIQHYIRRNDITLTAKKTSNPMAMQEQNASFAKRLGAQTAALNAQHKDAPIDTGFRPLPPGIKDGVARLASVGTKEYTAEEKIAALRGQVYFHASAVVVHPKEFANEKTEGRQIFLKIPMCAVPPNPATGSKGSTASENWFNFQNFFKCFGIGAPNETAQTDPTGAKVEKYYFAAMQGLMARIAKGGADAPHVEFTTREWQPPAKPGQPTPEKRYFTDWGMACKWTGVPKPAAAIVDTTMPPASSKPVKEEPSLHEHESAQAEAPAEAPAEETSIEEEVALLTQVAMEDPDGATEDGAAAAQRLEELAFANGWTEEDTKNADNWVAVGMMALNPPAPPTGGDENPGPDTAPDVGSRWHFAKRGRDGNKLVDSKGVEFPAIEVEVVTVNTEDHTCTVKTVKDGRDVIDPRSRKPTAVKWEWLE